MDKLRVLLGVNALSCLVFGFLFAVWPGEVAGWLGVQASWLLQATGAMLLINSVLLAIAARSPKVQPWQVALFSAGDLVWFTATLYALAFNWPVTTTHGHWAALAVGLGVGGLGLAQVFVSSSIAGFWRDGATADDHLPASLNTPQAASHSWLSMKRPVLAWLLFLNGVMLAALFYTHTVEAKVILAAYVASGPWLAAMVAAQRGLTRLLGLGHLVPWSPLMVYLLMQVLAPASATAMPLSLLGLTLATVGLCLALDAYDVWRWFSGERFRLGSPAAQRAFASRLAARVV
jgi:hypothetical protein